MAQYANPPRRSQGLLWKGIPWHWRIPFQLSTIPHRAIFNPQTKKNTFPEFPGRCQTNQKNDHETFKKKYPCNDLPFYRLSSC